MFGRARVAKELAERQAEADAYNRHFANHAKDMEFMHEWAEAQLAETLRIAEIKRLAYFGKEE